MNLIRGALPPSPNMDLDPPEDPKECHKTIDFAQAHLNPYSEGSGKEAYEEDEYNHRGGNVKCATH